MLLDFPLRCCWDGGCILFMRKLPQLVLCQIKLSTFCALVLPLSTFVSVTGWEPKQKWGSHYRDQQNSYLYHTHTPLPHTHTHSQHALSKDRVGLHVGLVHVCVWSSEGNLPSDFPLSYNDVIFNVLPLTAQSHIPLALLWSSLPPLRGQTCLLSPTHTCPSLCLHTFSLCCLSPSVLLVSSSAALVFLLDNRLTPLFFY